MASSLKLEIDERTLHLSMTGNDVADVADTVYWPRGSGGGGPFPAFVPLGSFAFILNGVAHRSEIE